MFRLVRRLGVGFGGFLLDSSIFLGRLRGLGGLGVGFLLVLQFAVHQFVVQQIVKSDDRSGSSIRISVTP